MESLGRESVTSLQLHPPGAKRVAALGGKLGLGLCNMRTAAILGLLRVSGEQAASKILKLQRRWLGTLLRKRTIAELDKGRSVDAPERE